MCCSHAAAAAAAAAAAVVALREWFAVQGLDTVMLYCVVFLGNDKRYKVTFQLRSITFLTAFNETLH